jgi:hypothetical protein
MRSITPLKGPIDGKGGVAWIEITSTVNNPDLSPLALQFLKYVQAPKVAHAVAFAERSRDADGQSRVSAFVTPDSGKFGP